MTIWAFNTPNKSSLEFVSKSLKHGISRFGWGYIDTADIRKLEKKSWDEMTKDEILIWNKTKFLKEISKGDWIVHINVPYWGTVIAGQVIEEYNFEESDNEISDFRHFFKLDLKTIIEFEKDDPIINSVISNKLKLRGKYWRIYDKIEFFESIENLNKRQNNISIQNEKSTQHNKTDNTFENTKIESIILSNFLNFNDININFAPGINLFIGENNIGKTGFIKFLYANLKAYEEYAKTKGTSKERSFKELLSIKLQNTFQSDDKIGTIVCKSNDKDSDNDLKSHLQITDNELSNKKIKISFKKSTQIEIPNLEFSDIKRSSTILEFNTVFIPAKEILSISNAIEIVNDRFKIDGFDDTFGDLIEDIKPYFIKNDNHVLKEVADSFKKRIIDGEIEYDKDKSKYFYRDKEGFKYDLTMTAEGVKQLGIIPLLIKTGKIKKGTVLFLDEPDNNLNPLIIRKFVYALFELASAGVQIFITTHNHLLSQYISLFTEYKDLDENFIDKKIPDNKFFALFKDKNNKTSIETGKDLLDISENLILDEFVKLHDKEHEFYNKSSNL